ncbi:MAG: MFS transporter [Anaerolineales bacterium]|nr:MFS transporter [Anaerolineales bacterium]
MKNRLRFQVLIFTATRVVLNTMYRMVYPFLAVFGRGMGVDLPTITLALTLRSFTGVFGPFLAFIGDSRGRKTGMLFGLAIFILGLSVVMIWPTFPGFLAALILSMLGKYIYDPSMQAYLGDRVIYQRRGRVLAITELSWSLSFLVGVPLMGFLIARYGWQAPFPVLALFGLLAFGVLAWMVPHDQVQPGHSAGLQANIRKILAYPPVLAGLAMAMLLSSANEVINLVFGIWLENSFGLMIAALGAAAAVIGVSELGGESLAAAITDRLGKPLAIGIGLGLNCLAALVLPILGSSTAGAVVGLFFFYLTFEYALVSSVPMMTEVMPSARATVMAVTAASVSLGRALGALIATPLFLFGESSATIPDILPNALAAIVLNAAALVALRYLHKGMLRRA